MSKIVLITGTTSRIGKASAHVFASRRYNLIIAGRRLERLKELLTRQSAQQHIGGKLIEKAKEKLSTTNLSVGEIA